MAETADYTLAGADGDVQSTQSFLDNKPNGPHAKDPPMPVLPKDCWNFVKQNPCERWPFFMYWVVSVFALVYGIIMFIGIKNGENITKSWITFNIVLLLVFGFAAYSFRIALAIREQVNREAALNREFKQQNRELRADVDKLEMANNELRGVAATLGESNKRMQENVKKFTQLNENLQKFAGGNIEGMEKLKNQVGKMNDQWRENMIKNEKSLFLNIFDAMELKDGDADMSPAEWDQFLSLLPEDYKELFTKFTWEELAGEDGMMQFEEFSEHVDKVVEGVVDTKMKE